jgi:hypothetical protein
MLRILPLFLLLFGGCYAEEVAEDLNREPFFDLASYIDEQVDSLKQAGTPVTKTIVLNGQREAQTRDDVDFAADLRVFREADINRPAWLDKYAVERSTEDGLTTEVYSARDSSLQTRQLSVTRAGAQVQAIRIFRRTGTVLSDGDHHLTYEPNRGYDLRSQQVNRFGEDLDATITVRW